VGYGLALQKRGSNSSRYWALMKIARAQSARLCAGPRPIRDSLKAIDEYNYCKHTKGWI